MCKHVINVKLQIMINNNNVDSMYKHVIIYIKFTRFLLNTFNNYDCLNRRGHVFLRKG